MFALADLGKITHGMATLEQAIPGNNMAAFGGDSREWFELAPQFWDCARQRVAMRSKFAQKGSGDAWQVNGQNQHQWGSRCCQTAFNAAERAAAGLKIEKDRAAEGGIIGAGAAGNEDFLDA